MLSKVGRHYINIQFVDIGISQDHTCISAAGDNSSYGGCHRRLHGGWRWHFNLSWHSHSCLLMLFCMTTLLKFLLRIMTPVINHYIRKSKIKWHNILSIQTYDTQWHYSILYLKKCQVCLYNTKHKHFHISWNKYPGCCKICKDVILCNEPHIQLLILTMCAY